MLLNEWGDWWYSDLGLFNYLSIKIGGVGG